MPLAMHTLIKEASMNFILLLCRPARWSSVALFSMVSRARLWRIGRRGWRRRKLESGRSKDRVEDLKIDVAEKNNDIEKGPESDGWLRLGSVCVCVCVCVLSEQCSIIVIR